MHTGVCRADGCNGNKKSETSTKWNLASLNIATIIEIIENNFVIYESVCWRDGKARQIVLRRMLDLSIVCKWTTPKICGTITTVTHLLLYKLITVSHYYPRDALHSAVFAVVRCLSVRPSHPGIVSKRLNLSENVFDHLVSLSFLFLIPCANTKIQGNPISGRGANCMG